MKEILESREIFESYVRHDYWLFILDGIQKEMQGRKRSPIEKAIDKTTGYSDSVELTDLMNVLECLEGTLVEKNIMEADTEQNEDAVSQLKLLIKSYTDKGVKPIETKRLKWED